MKDIEIHSMDHHSFRTNEHYQWLGSVKKETEELCFTECGIEQCEPGHEYGPVIRKEFYVHCIMSGSGEIQIDGITYYPKRGELFLLPPDKLVRVVADLENPWYYAWISFAGTRAEELLLRAGLGKEKPIRRIYFAPEEMLEKIQKLISYHEITLYNELMRTQIVYDIMALLIHSYTEQHPLPQGQEYTTEAYITAAEDYIKHNFHYIHVTDVANHIGISRFYLAEIFRKKLKISPSDYILRCKMKAAQELLITTNLPVGQIAEQLGYDNPFSFSQSFKKYYGLSPKSYRTENQHSSE